VRESIATAAATSTAGSKTAADSTTKLLDSALREVCGVVITRIFHAAPNHMPSFALLTNKLIGEAMKEAGRTLSTSSKATLGAAFAKAKAETLQSARGFNPPASVSTGDVLREHCLDFVRRVGSHCGHCEASPVELPAETDWSDIVDYLHSAVHAKFS
jgi:hypothetical protein